MAMRQRTRLRWRIDLDELIVAAASGDHSVLEYRFERDKARDNAAATDRKQTLRYGWMHVRWDACATALEVAKVLRVQGWAGTPRPCSPGCPVQRDFCLRAAV
jgi:hypothetical protein